MNRVAIATSTLLGIDINVVVMIYLPTYLPERYLTFQYQNLLEKYLLFGGRAGFARL